LAVGSNYDDKLYLGGAIAFSRVKLSEETSFREEADYLIVNSELADYTVSETKNTTGTGFGLKLGAIYRFNNNLRAGLAYHSPTFMSFVSDQSTTFQSNYSDGEIRSQNSTTRISEYNLSSPSKIIGSLAVIINKSGVIDVDYEVVDHSKMRLRPGGSAGADFTEQNQNISDNFKSVSNVRIGGEWRIQPFSLRGGIAYYDNPNNSDTDAFVSGSTIYSMGAGYKRKGAYIDVAYRVRTSDINTFIYNPTFAEVVEQEDIGNSFSMTFGVRF